MNEQASLNDRLRQAAAGGDLPALIQALEDGADAKEDDSWALLEAAQNGHGECVKLLIPVSDPLARQSYALRWAAYGGCADCVKLLIPVSDPMEHESLALFEAARCGHVDCVRMLIAVSDPLARNSVALRWAAVKGQADCVALLLPASDPLAVGDDGLAAAGLAKSQGHTKVARMIEAFIEAKALSSSAQHAKWRPRSKSAL
jgi:hypothetical protein